MSEYAASPSLISEYIRNDMERASGYSPLSLIVYDCIDCSPYYDNDNPNDMYYDERDAIDVPAPTDHTEGTINEPYQKKYMFNPSNIPYQLER